VGRRTTLDVLNAEIDIATAQLALKPGRVGLLMDHLRLFALVGATRRIGDAIRECRGS
jgi:outer membrane protein TolC